MRSDLKVSQSEWANLLAVASESRFVRKQYDSESSVLLERLEESVAEFDRVINEFTGDRQLDYCRVSAVVRQLCSLIRLTELSGVSRENVRTIVEPAREIHSLSPFISRIQRWPRNYMGDFETIEYLCSGVSRAAPNSTGELLEHLAFNCVAAQQHRYKVSWAADQALHIAYRVSEARILSIACGGSLDLRRVQRPLAERDVLVYLNDADPDALSWSKDHLPLLSCRINCVPGNVFRSVAKLTNEAPFDLIIAGGLFDYLADKQLIWLIPKLVNLLSTEGQLCFTNIAIGNVDRVWMEYMANWFMIERDESDIRSLIRESRLSNQVSLDVRRDPSAATLLVKLIKNALPREAETQNCGHY